MLHSFGRLRDGAEPMADVINVNGTLYGTTSGGADSYSSGTVFAITTAGKETVVHRLGGSPDDGSRPQAGLINLNGTLYGTTGDGGAKGDGTVFAITPSVPKRCSIASMPLAMGECRWQAFSTSTARYTARQSGVVRADAEAPLATRAAAQVSRS